MDRLTLSSEVTTGCFGFDHIFQIPLKRARKSKMKMKKKKKMLTPKTILYLREYSRYLDLASLIIEVISIRIVKNNLRKYSRKNH